MRANIALYEIRGLLVELFNKPIDHSLNIECLDGKSVQTSGDIKLVVDEKVDRDVKTKD